MRHPPPLSGPRAAGILDTSPCPCAAGAFRAGRSHWGCPPVTVAPEPSPPTPPPGGPGVKDPARPGRPALPTVTLPTGGGAIRGIDEKLTVGLATGTAGLTVTVATSGARHDFGPKLELRYDSGGGNGPFG